MEKVNAAWYGADDDLIAPSSSTLTASESDETIRVCSSSPLQWDDEDEKDLLSLGSHGDGPSLEELERTIRPVGFAGTESTWSPGTAAPLVASRELTRGILESSEPWGTSETCTSDSRSSQGWQAEAAAGETGREGMAKDRARYFQGLLSYMALARDKSATPPATHGFENIDAAVLTNMEEFISRMEQSPANFSSSMFDAPVQTAMVGNSEDVKQEITAEQNTISYASSPESHEEAGGSDVVTVGSDQSTSFTSLGSHEEEAGGSDVVTVGSDQSTSFTSLGSHEEEAGGSDVVTVGSDQSTSFTSLGSHEEAGGSDVVTVGSDQSTSFTSLESHNYAGGSVVVKTESLLASARIFHAATDGIVLVDLGWFYNREPGVTVRAALAHTGVCATKLLLRGVMSNPKCFHVHHHARNHIATKTLKILMTFIGAHDRTDPAYQTIFRHLRDFSATDAFLAHALDHGNFPPRLHALQERAMVLRNQPNFDNAEYMVCQYLAQQAQQYIKEKRTRPSCFGWQQQQ